MTDKAESMIERVARAIAYEHCNRKQWVGACSKEDGLRYYADNEWKTFVPAARTAIKAMVPLPDGIANEMADYFTTDIVMGSASDAQSMWKQFINKILKEGE